VDDIRIFLKLYGHFSSEREIDGIIRRLDTTGDSTINFSELSYFLQTSNVPKREVSRSISRSPMRGRQVPRSPMVESDPISELIKTKERVFLIERSI
jgi:hypothetical protein